MLHLTQYQFGVGEKGKASCGAKKPLSFSERGHQTKDDAIPKEPSHFYPLQERKGREINGLSFFSVYSTVYSTVHPVE